MAKQVGQQCGHRSYNGLGMSENNYDPQAVAFYDIAHEGAQIRAVAGAVAEGAFARLAGKRPRSVVILATDAVSRASARLAVTLRSPLTLPVVVDTSLPSYVGPLDVVVSVTEKGDDYELGRALSVASTRGCEIIFAGLGEGPLAEQVADTDAVVVPHLPNTEGVSPLRTLATVLAVIDCLGGECDIIGQELFDLADEVDAELNACSPERDDLVNPARALAQLGPRIVHTGHEPVGMAIAPIAAALWTMKGKVAAILDFEELGMAKALFTSAPVDDIFYDPEIDGPRTDNLDIVVWNASEPRIMRGHAQTVAKAATSAIPVRLVARSYAATAFTP